MNSIGSGYSRQALARSRARIGTAPGAVSCECGSPVSLERARREPLVKDLRHGARQLRLNPGFTAVAILSLALGIGANSAIFQLINALRLRSLPVDNPEQLVAIDAVDDVVASGWSEGRHRVFTYAQLEQIGAHQQAFSSLMAFGTARFNLSRGGEARYVRAARREAEGAPTRGVLQLGA